MAKIRPKIEPFSLRGLKDFKLAGELDSNVFLTGVNHDSNEIHAGDLFVALSGEKTHGASYFDQAVSKGASAILTDSAGSKLLPASPAVPVLVMDELRGNLGQIAAKIYGEPSKKLQVFGVTGTNGKTTTSWLLNSGLEKAGLKTALIGTAGIKIGNLSFDSARTTPEAPHLQAMLALALEQGLSAVVMEVSSHALALDRVIGTNFQAVGFTNLSQDHLDFHGTMEDYFKAKQKLFNRKYSDFAAICLQDQWGQRLAAEVEISKTTIGTQSYANWILEDISPALGHVDFNLVSPSTNKYEVKLEFAGAFNAFNAALAVAMTNELEIPREEFIQGLRQAHIPGRMEPILVPEKALGIVDYAHTPEAIAAVLETLRGQTNGKIIAVLGAGGNRDVKKRELMGKAAESADLIVITDDNPRLEDPKLIRSALLAGIGDRSKVVEIADRKEAIFYATSNSNSLDTVVVLGKGHEAFQEVAGIQIPFSDSEVLLQALTESASE